MGSPPSLIAAHRIPESLLVNSHKENGLKIGSGRWASRPIVGLMQWFCTASSNILKTLGSSLLKLDAQHSPLATPVKDTLDYATPLEPFFNDPLDANIAWTATSVDFTTLHTIFGWKDVGLTYDFCHQFWHAHDDKYAFFTPGNEFERLSNDEFSSLLLHFPYTTVKHHPLLLRDEVFLVLNCTKVFFKPKNTVCGPTTRLCDGCLLHTPMCLVLRAYELMISSLLCCLFVTLIDDMCIIHL